jgi:hypothetical protein
MPQIEVINASATKNFFIRMITRDILLQDCILDLIDNSIDGATRWQKETNASVDEETRYSAFHIRLTLSADEFHIDDNCRGMSIELAKTKAFHFGRPSGIDERFDSIGLYGIGMKRALFKLGTHAKVESSTGAEAFRVVIDVPVWEAKEEWTLDLEHIDVFEPAGTKITVDALTPETSLELSDELFKNSLRRYVARDYSFFLQKGLAVSVNDDPVQPYRFELRTGGEVEPVSYRFEEDGVAVKITAGLAGLPPDDESPEAGMSDVDFYGWFVVCNDRVVLAADKTSRTVWGDDGFAIWHPQYNGFMGVVFFSADDPGKLPWSTTKRDVDHQNPVYRVAIEKMKTATQQYIDYSGARKRALDQAKQAESAAQPVNVRRLPEARVMKVPAISGTDQYKSVCFQAKRSDIKKAATALGSPSMPATRVGLETFKYYLRNEVEE